MIIPVAVRFVLRSAPRRARRNGLPWRRICVLTIAGLMSMTESDIVVLPQWLPALHRIQFLCTLRSGAQTSPRSSRILQDSADHGWRDDLLSSCHWSVAHTPSQSAEGRRNVSLHRIRCLGRLGFLGAIFRATRNPISHTAQIHRASHKVIFHTRAILRTSSTHEYNRMLLHIVTFTRNIRRNNPPTTQPHSCNLPLPRIRLLRLCSSHS